SHCQASEAAVGRHERRDSRHRRHRRAARRRMDGDEALIVIDTHALVWQLNADSRMGRKARARLEKGLVVDQLAVSAVTFWEVALLVTRGRLHLDSSTTQFRWRVLEMGIRELSLSGAGALEAADLAPALVAPVAS